jgi:transcriptional regulator with XRE-family HTH domain
MAHDTNTPLRMAIFVSGQKQFEIAKKAGIAESRMSKLARGHEDATDDEMKALARVLRKPVGDLFPDHEEVTR